MGQKEASGRGTPLAWSSSHPLFYRGVLIHYPRTHRHLLFSLRLSSFKRSCPKAPPWNGHWFPDTYIQICKHLLMVFAKLGRCIASLFRVGRTQRCRCLRERRLHMVNSWLGTLVFAVICFLVRFSGFWGFVLDLISLFLFWILKVLLDVHLFLSNWLAFQFRPDPCALSPPRAPCQPSLRCLAHLGVHHRQLPVNQKPWRRVFMARAPSGVQFVQVQVRVE